MKKINFLPNKKILLIHFKMNWPLITFFTIFWLIIVIGLTWILNLDSKYKSIAPLVAPIVSSGSNGVQNDEGLANVFRDYIFGFVGITFFSIVSISIVSTIITRELKGGQISFWISTSNSRNKIILSKILFSLITLFIVFVPSYLFSIFYLLSASDSKINLKYIATYGISFLLFVIFLNFIYILIATFFSEKNILGLIVSSVLLVYIITTCFLTMIWKLNPDMTVIKNMRYIFLNSLIPDSIDFKDVVYDHNNILSGTIYGEHINKPFGIILVFWIAEIILIGIAISIINILFNKKDLQI